MAAIFNVKNLDFLTEWFILESKNSLQKPISIFIGNCGRNIAILG